MEIVTKLNLIVPPKISFTNYYAGTALTSQRFIFEDTHLVGDIIPEGATPSMLIIHGGGKGSRYGFKELRTELALHGVSSVAFDCIGHGDTGGSLDGATLESRTNQALSVLRNSGVRQPMTILGSSMGAYNAVKLCELFPVENLILFTPAMYTVAAYRTPFGPTFPTLIRQPGSWKDSDAWNILSEFKGNIVIVRAERDDIIPSGLIELIKQSSRNARMITEHTVLGAPHSLAQHLTENPTQLREVVEVIVNNITGHTGLKT